MIELIRSSLILFEREGFFFLQEKVTGSLLVEILLTHSLSYAIQHQQHLIERDVDLHVVLECLKKGQVFYDQSNQFHIEIFRIF